MLPRAIDREICECMHRTHMGVDADYVSLLLHGVRTALSDGWSGSMLATILSDILFGTPKPVKSVMNLGVLKEDYVNIIVHGHNPVLSMKVVEAGMIGCFYTGDFFNLFVMIEVTAIASYALVSYFRSDRVAVAASLKYAVYGALATTAYSTATIFAYGSLGTLNMADMHVKVVGAEAPITGSGYGNVGLGLLVFTALALYAFTFKSALFPNHSWLPEAHSSAPTPVSALLSGLVVNVGVYAMARFAYTVIGPAALAGSIIPPALLITGAASAVVGGLLMNVQADVKRLIAYSTVMNLGFVALGYGLATPLGAAAATYHLITHSVAKAMLFMAAGLAIARRLTKD